MLKVAASVVIHKPVEEVYAFVSGEGNYTRWQPAVVEVIEQGPRNTVGSHFTEVRRFLGQELRTTMEITELIPNVRWVGRVIEGPVLYHLTITYEAVGGGTKITDAVEGETRGFFKLAENLVAASLEKSMREDLERLKGILEKA